MKNEHDKSSETTTENPGMEVLLRALATGAAITDLMHMSIAFLLDPARGTPEKKEALGVYKQTLSEKLAKYSENMLRETQQKQPMTKVLDKIKDAALLKAGNYAEDNPLWDMFLHDVDITESEFKELGEQVVTNLRHKDPAIREESQNWLVSAGFVITDIIYSLEPSLDKLFVAKMIHLMAALKVQVALTVPNSEIKELQRALEYTKMLESRGVYFDAQGNPQYTEQYYETQKKENAERDRFYGNSNNSSNTGADSPEGTV